MKNIFKTLIILLFTCNTLLAQESTQALYEKALKAYDEKEFAQAYEGFKVYLAQDSRNKPVQFYLARSAYEIGKYEEALALYEAIAKKDPDIIRVQLEIAQTLFQLQRYEEAKIKYDHVKTHTIPDEVKNNINTMLTRIEEKTQKHFVSSSVFLGFVYDSNIFSNANAGDYSIYVPQTSSYLSLNNSGETKSDSIVQTIATINHIYKLEDDVLIENKVLAGKYTYLSYHEKDLGIVSLSTALSALGENYKTSVGLSFDGIYEGGSHYLNGVSVYLPRFEMRLDEKTFYESYLKYNRKSFSRDEDSQKDSYSFEAYNAISLIDEAWGKNTLALTLGRTYKEDGDRTDIDMKYYALTLGNNYTFTPSLMLSNQISFQKNHYLDQDINFLSKRDDKHIAFESTLIMMLSKNMTIGAGFQYVNSDSNHDPFAYDKYTLRTFMNYQF